MHFVFINSISEVEASQWNALWPCDYPFTRHEFLHALEASGSTNTASGWQPCHLLVKDNDNYIFCMPVFIKTHSYGEYVFDWAWADAYERCGVDYYPKLINAIPFTPATGPRYGIAESIQNSDDFFNQVQHALQAKVKELGASGFHSLFPQACNDQFKHYPSWQERQGCQFHWFNKDYKHFDDFLATLCSRKRKTLKKERAKVADIEVELIEAALIDDTTWQWFYQLYHRTYLKRSGRPGYLGEDFFQRVGQSLPNNVLLAIAKQNDEKIAGAVYFRDEHTLYGRYWGALDEIDGLHFETCYYQGIEYAIKHSLLRFDPGAQGEHKIQRGFEPVYTRSYHWLAHPEFNQAITEFCRQDREQTASYLQQAREYLPFKEGTELVKPDYLLTRKR